MENRTMAQILYSIHNGRMYNGQIARYFKSEETKKDFIHKVSIVMKELRETMINLSIISNLESNLDNEELKKLLQENNELIAIFHKTVQTARKNAGLVD